MKIQITKIVLAVVFGLTLCFAQVASEKLAVYAYGASDAGINKSLGSKLLVAMVQNGTYVEIGDPSSFHDELAKSGKGSLAWIIQVAKHYGADYLCAVNITEVFGTHSISARLIKISGSQIIKTSSIDHSLKSLEDMTVVSNELASKLLPPIVAPSLSVLAPVAVQNQCAKIYDINELLSKIKNYFPRQLKNCSSNLAKDMLTPTLLGGKQLEPQSFMMQCPVEGIKKELPDGFPNTDKILGSLTNFLHGLLNFSLADGAIDPKKLISAVSSMNIYELLNEVKKHAADECVVDKPH